MKALSINTTVDISIIEVEEPLYKALNPVVGGYIEIVNPKGLPSPYCMIVDEEGFPKGKDLNLVGCILYGTAQHGQKIVGDIAIMRQQFGNDGIDLAGLTDQDILFLLKHVTQMVVLSLD